MLKNLVQNKPVFDAGICRQKYNLIICENIKISLMNSKMENISFIFSNN